MLFAVHVMCKTKTTCWKHTTERWRRPWRRHHKRLLLAFSVQAGSCLADRVCGRPRRHPIVYMSAFSDVTPCWRHRRVLALRARAVKQRMYNSKVRFDVCELCTAKPGRLSACTSTQSRNAPMLRAKGTVKISRTACPPPHHGKRDGVRVRGHTRGDRPPLCGPGHLDARKTRGGAGNGATFVCGFGFALRNHTSARSSTRLFGCAHAVEKGMEKAGQRKQRECADEKERARARGSERENKRTGWR